MNDSEPLAQQEPDWASSYVDASAAEEASRRWAAVMADLNAAGTIADANGHTVRRLVEFLVHYWKSAKHVAEHGAILAAKRAKIGQWNPHWSAMQHADDA